MSMAIDYSAGEEPSTVGSAMAKALEERALLYRNEEWGTHRLRKDFIADEALRGTGMSRLGRTLCAGGSCAWVARGKSKR